MAPPGMPGGPDRFGSAVDRAATETGGRRRAAGAVAFTLVAYAFVVVMLGTTLPTPLYPIYQRELGLSPLTITVVFSMYAFGVMSGLILFGRLSDQVGRRPMLLVGIGLSAASALCFLFEGGLAALLVGRYLSGLSSGIYTGTATATLVDLVPDRAKSRATLIATAANMGGLGLGPPFAGVLAQWLPRPLRLCFIIDLGLLALAVLAILSIPEPIASRVRPGLRIRRPRVPPEVRSVFAPAATAGFAGFSVLGLYSGISPAFLSTVLGHKSHALAGLVVFLVFGSSLVGQTLMDRVGEARALPGGCGLMVAGMALLAVGLRAEVLALLIVGGVIAGVGQGLSFRAGLGAVNRASPLERRGEVASSFFVTLYIAISIPIIGLGVLARQVGLRTAGLTFTAVVALIAMSAVAILVRSRSVVGPEAVREQIGESLGSK